MERLEWDSEFFGFPVARLFASATDSSGVEHALKQAQRDHVRLVYLFDGTCHEFPTTMLERLGGRLVDRRVTYELPMTVDASRRDAPSAEAGITINQYREPTANPELRALALAAGEYSRFRVDRQMPAGAFEKLYDRWIERSVNGQIADCVLVAGGPEEMISGLLTIQRREDRGVIGLVAVAADARGRGIGRRLMSAAHSWMRDAEIDISSVTTQSDNVAACRLYETCGYEAVQREHIYHFWLSNDAC